MSPRLFISYRTSDGADKATALARDLNAVFGAEQVFLDKEDLTAGLRWRDAIGAALDGQPVLLLLITPQLLGPRLEDENDPVRREVAAALAAGAHVIPLLADGVERLPQPHEWPAAMHGLTDHTWRRLRAYDWREDVQRLVADLEALGVPRRSGAEAAAAERAVTRRRVAQFALVFAVGALAGGGASSWWWSTRAPARGGDPASPLAGTWSLQVAPPADDTGTRLDAVTLHLSQAGEEVKLYSEPIDITRDPAWAGFAQQWQERFGEAFERVVWRGAGRARLEQGAPPAIDVGLRVETPAPGGSPIETGNLRAELDADGARMAGRVWMNGEQVERAAVLTRVVR